MFEFIVKVMIGFLLLICAIQDIYYKKISIWIVVFGVVLLSVSIPFLHNLSLLDRVLGALVGVGVIGISKATGGKIGIGDGLILFVTGIGLGFWGNLELFAIALLIAAGLSVFLLVFRLANRKKSIPFIPFLLLGYIINQVYK